MPLITVANSPSKDDALAGLERWKQRHPEAAAQLAVDDVLVDAMRGRSSTWTRIRVNLRHVPEASRPPQETPDPDDDPTREWREAMRKEKEYERLRRLALTPTLSRKREREVESARQEPFQKERFARKSIARRRVRRLHEPSKGDQP